LKGGWQLPITEEYHYHISIVHEFSIGYMLYYGK
jgi:hypothetical protein